MSLLRKLLCLAAPLLGGAGAAQAAAGGASAPAAEPVICAEAHEASITDATWRIEREAYARLGLRPRLQTLPSRRCLSEAEAGRAQGLLYRTTTIEPLLPEVLRVPTAVGRVELIAMGRQADLRISSWEQLRPWRIAALRGRIHIENKTAGMQTTFVSTSEQMLRMLEAGRIDILVGERLRMLPLLQQLRAQGLPLAGVRELGLIEALPVYHYLHSSQAALLEPLDQQFRALTREGFFDKVWDEARRGLPPLPSSGQ